ncbi:MAG: uncharacterized membrane protein YqaE (UPF0057 family) [Flavobacteriaceae bacterium]|jgi:uncharacterized membrane protein YqaE (UPF0057 family)
MKKLASINLLIILVLILGACSTSNNVVNNNLISKRKYTKGFHINKKSNLSTDKDKIANSTELASEETFSVSSSENISFTHMEANDARSVSNSSELGIILEGFTFELATPNAVVPFDLVVTTESDAPETEASETENSIETKDSKVNSEKNEVKKKRKSTSRKQKNKKNQGSGGDAIFILAVICAILLPPLGVAIYTNIDWVKVLIALVLMLLFFLPGMIYALLVVFDVI